MRRALTLILCGIAALAVAGSPGLSAPKEEEKKPDEAAVKRARKTVRMLDDVYKQAIVLITDKYVKTKKDYPAGRAAIKWLNDIGKAGHPKTEVAHLSGVSLRSVKRIAEEEPVMHVDDQAERTKRQIGRPSTVTTFRKQVVEVLQQQPDLASLEILRRVREAGYQGGKTALYALVASLRPKSTKPLVRFEGLPGEFSQHDFGQIEVQFVDGASRRIHFFASPVPTHTVSESDWTTVTAPMEEEVSCSKTGVHVVPPFVVLNTPPAAVPT